MADVNGDSVVPYSLSGQSTDNSSITASAVIGISSAKASLLNRADCRIVSNSDNANKIQDEPDENIACSVQSVFQYIDRYTCFRNLSRLKHRYWAEQTVESWAITEQVQIDSRMSPTTAENIIYSRQSKA